MYTGVFNLPNRLWSLVPKNLQNVARGGGGMAPIILVPIIKLAIIAVLSCGEPTDIWGLKKTHNLFRVGFLTTR